MSRFSAEVTWKRDGATFTDRRYSRGHIWRFDGGAEVPASASPHVVPLPYSIEENVDPEEAYVAALSSCHMLFFLDFASRKKFVVDSYVDSANGVMEKQDGKTLVTRVELCPKVTYTGTAPSPKVEAELHHAAHDACFLANSVKTDISIKLAQI
ncbi:OsmC family protein [Thalassospira alkalitolerans]|uniref:Peroxiredoxin n=1 Tax=Thalassospira alkalitolerans TaxID=1293890 RepID=A0A1Y2LI80_9PROT|nr:OsmC family protein [Thalassospira alkalitolerans]OSQ50253.1 peroxiredoxin [Thalassospira alkalitolerans]